MKVDIADFAKRFATRSTILGMIGLLAVFFLYTYNLDGVQPNMSSREVTSIGRSVTREDIQANPLYLPHRAGSYVLNRLGIQKVEAYRAISAFFVVAVIFLFYRLMRKWHSPKIAAVSTALLASSSWLLAVGRSATPTSLFLIWFVLIEGLFWIRHSSRRRLAIYLATLVTLVALYVPGTIYLLIIFAILYGKRASTLFRKLALKHQLILITFTAIFVGLLSYALFKNHLIKEWLLIPDPLTPKIFMQNLIALPRALFYAAPYRPEFWIAGLPLLDLFSGTMLLLGLYAYRYYLRMKRTPLVWICLLTITLIVGFAGLEVAIMLVPFLYIVIANGMTFMLGTWFETFPKNPIAKNLGVVIMAIAIGFSMFYHFERYFVAWPKSPATKELYSIKQ